MFVNMAECNASMSVRAKQLSVTESLTAENVFSIDSHR